MIMIPLISQCLIPGHDVAVLGVLGQMPGHGLVALAAEGVVLPGLDSDLVPLGVDHGRWPLNIANIAAPGADGGQGHGQDDDQDHDGGWVWQCDKCQCDSAKEFISHVSALKRCG